MSIAVASAPCAWGGVVLTNLGQPSPGANSNVGTFGATGSSSAQGFFTGSDPSGYSLESLVLEFLAPGGFGSTGDLNIEIWDDGGSEPGAPVISFGVNNPNSGGTFTFTPLAAATLAANTHYYVVASTPDAAIGAGVGQNTYFWRVTPSTAEDAESQPGWSIDDEFRTAATIAPNAGTSWNPTSDPNPLRLEINASVVPEPSSIGLLIGGGLLLCVKRRR